MKKHWLDMMVDDSKAALSSLMDDARYALHDDLPIGKRALTKREQLARFMKMTPDDHQALITEKGVDEYNRFIEAAQQNARSLLGDDMAASLFVADEV